jgi:Protein of unknown function (DUF3309)
MAAGRQAEPIPGARLSFAHRNEGRARDMLGTILLVLLILMLLGAWPTWPYSRGWGYGPSGLMSILLIVIIVLLATGRL